MPPVSQPRAAAGGADEEPHLRIADGDGVSCENLHLHRVWYFEQLLTTSEEVPDSIRPLLKLRREHIRPLDADGYGAASIPRARSAPGPKRNTGENHGDDQRLLPVLLSLGRAFHTEAPTLQGTYRHRDNAGVNDHVVNNSKDRLQAFQGSEWFVGYTDTSLRTT